MGLFRIVERIYSEFGHHYRRQFALLLDHQFIFVPYQLVGG